MLQYITFQLLTLSATMILISTLLLIVRLIKEAKNEKL